ncbi:WYL domain containing protein [uncultured Caudovirales phage]|uniref:WYL domain containing protein n=1 Tax=uncultured Caudovirales phage TaxID=2100421 RepID=A0A6J7WKF3_9CAUD|nr:WYL domain containing protein [uncultured Caudovirales phage]
MHNIKLKELPTDDERNRYLRNLLGNNDCEITFTKVDGTVRTMPCTLRTEAMPQRVVTEEHQTTKLYKPETLSVWCLDKSEWRSFRVANVTEVKVLGT